MSLRAPSRPWLAALALGLATSVPFAGLFVTNLRGATPESTLVRAPVVPHPPSLQRQLDREQTARNPAIVLVQKN